MNDIDVNKAVKYFQDVVTNHYFDSNGRVSLRDYWTYVAVYFVIAIAVAIVTSIIGLRVLLSLLQLALLLPSASMTARRIQDTGKSGSIVWALVVPMLIINLVGLFTALSFGLFGLVLLFLPLMFLLSLASLVIAIYLIYLCIQPGTAGPNAYGPPPSDATATGVAA